jgi:cytochrome c oxidase subunit 2
MWSGFPLFPEQASTVASRVDALYLFLIAISVFFSLLIAGLVVVFAVQFRRRSDDEQPREILGSFALELTWTLVPLAIVMVVFFWSAQVYFNLQRVPPNAMEVYVVGKRWMWKAQHMTGQREINELHVPMGVPVKITLASEDVIHSFYVPAFRVKKDAVPGRYQHLWFQATKPGTYHLFCAEYCGTKHSGMIGWVTVMEPAAFQTWLAGGPPSATPAVAGQKLFTDLGCVTCHRPDTEGRGPRLDGLYGSTQALASGETVTVDETYIRESILNPAGKVAAGYQPIMPTFQGRVDEDGLLQLTAYIRSLSAPGAGAPAGPATAASPAASPATTTHTPEGAGESRR